MRLHVRAIVRDGTQAFVGSQSLRKDELDKRREVGLIINNPAVARKIMQVFEADWAASSKRRQGEGEEGRLGALDWMWTISPLPGAFTTNLFHAAAFLSAWRSTIPPHHIEPCAGMATHTRLTFAATPKPGTLSVKYGGSAAGDAPVISSRTPSGLTSTIFDDTPSIDEYQSRHQLARRAAGRPAFGQGQRDRQQEGVARHRAIDPRRIARHLFDRVFRIADQDQRTVLAERLDDARQVGWLRRATRRRSALRSACVVRSRPTVSMLEHRHRVVAGQRQPLEKRGALAGNRAGDANS